MNPQLQEALDALEKADAAGNVEDAKELADYIRQLQAQEEESSSGDMIYPAAGAAIGSTFGAIAGPAVGSAVDTAATKVAEKVAGPKGTPRGDKVAKWLATQTTGPNVGGATFKEAFKKSETARGVPVQSRGSNIPIRKGFLGIENQPAEPSLPQKTAANIISNERLGKPSVARRIGGMGVMGAEAGKTISDIEKGDTGEAILSGIGTVGGALSQSRIKPLRAIGTGLSLLVPTVQGGKEVKDIFYPSKEEEEKKAAGGLVHLAKGKSVDEEKPFVGYPQIKRTNRNPNFKPQVDKYTGMFDALIGGGKRENLSVFDPKEMAYSEAYDKYEPAGIALMGAPFLGGPIKSLGKALAPKAGQAAEDLLARQGLISYAAPRAKMSPGLSFGNMAPVNAQTVTNPLRNEFPGIYKRPDVIAQEAAARVASEDPMLKRLFGVTRDDLFEMSQRQGNVPGFIPGASKNPKGSAAAEAVMNPRNTQRLIDVLGEVKTNAPELYKGMHAWYTMDPQYHRMVELMGEEKAKQMYHRLNTFGGIESPNLPVPVEFNRASAANWLAEQGRMPDWIKYGGLRDKPLIEGIPADMIGIPGRVGHQRASESQRKFMETGEHGMISPKAPPYIQASSVPELGFQTDLPVGDAHWSRMIGLPDVRTSKEVSASVSTPELQQLAPWWKKDVAGAMDLESVPAQAIMWGAGSPQTGVKTAIGAGKLELQAIQIAEAAKRLGISPENARDLILMGKERAGKKEGGSTTPAWQRSEGKSPSGGLNALGRASYKRETGGELKAPQPEGGSRKKSFCARMGGMKKKLTSSKTANDPDSRINKALRKWKC